MHQTLLYIPSELAGWPVLGWGLLLAAWVIFSIGLLAWVGLREGRKEMLGYLPTMILIGALIVFLLPRLGNEHGIPIRSWGTMLLLGILASTGLLIYRGRKIGLDSDSALSLLFWMVIPGLIGARVFYIIEYWHDFMRPTIGETLIAMVNMPDGGMVAYGSLIGGLLGMVTFVRIRRLPILPLCDLLAPCMLVGLAFGRIGCLLNGCCYGGVSDLPMAVTFPPESPPYISQIVRGEMLGLRFAPDKKNRPTVARVESDWPGEKAGLVVGDKIQSINSQPIDSIEDLQRALYQASVKDGPISFKTDAAKLCTVGAGWTMARSRPVQPTQLYSVINALVLCFFLLAYEPFKRRDGVIFGLLLTLYPITRFLLEIIRHDEVSIFGTGLSISQNVSILILLAIVGYWIFLLLRPRGVTRQLT
jgi:phosphatidylglycerol---prolipoprotein diacylglyceryl transferase